MADSSANNAVESAPVDLKAIEDSLSSVGVVKSAAQGRIRIQLRPEYRTPETMARLKVQLEQDERVQEVTINERTGSVTVKYPAEHHGHSLVWKAVQEAELVGEAAFDLPEDEEDGDAAPSTGPQSTYGKLDQQISDVVYKFDLAVFRRTRGKIHLRGRVLPLGIAGFGVAQMVIYGISLEMLPGPLLIWLAHDIHHRISKEPPMTLTDPPVVPGDATLDAGNAPSAGALPASGATAPAAA